MGSLFSVPTQIPESDVEPGHVVGDVAVEVDQHRAGLTHQLGDLLDLVEILPDHPGVHGAEVGEDLRKKIGKRMKIFVVVVWRDSGVSLMRQISRLPE